MVIDRYFVVDTQKPLTLQNIRDTLVVGDKNAHRFNITLTKRGEAMTVAGNVHAYFKIANGTTVHITGTISDNTVSVVLPADCYAVSGYAQLLVDVVTTNEITTVAAFNMQVISGSGDNVIDASGSIPSLPELLSQLDTMRTATQNANNIIGPILNDVKSLKTEYVRVGDDSEEIEVVEQAEFDELKGDVTALKGYEKLAYTEKYYITTNLQVGDTVILEPQYNTNYVYATAPCKEGDRFVVTYEAGQKPRGYAFIDSNNKLLEVDRADRIVTDLEVFAPKNAAMFITNAYRYHSYSCVKGNDRVGVIENNLADVMNMMGQCYLRDGLNINTKDGRFEFPVQRIFVKNAQKDIPETTLSYNKANTYAVVVFDNDTDSFKVKYSITEKFSNNEFVVAVINLASIKKSFVAGYYTVDGKLPFAEKIAEDINFAYKGLENAIYTWWTYPHAIRYKGMRDKTYIAYVDNKGKQGVISINNKTGNIERTVLRTGDKADDHNAPCVNIINGYVVVVACGHMSTNSHHVYVSKEKESISAFDEHEYSLPAGYKETTYETLIECGGKWWLFFRCQDAADKTYWGFRTSVNGSAWSDAKIFLDGSTYKYYCLARTYDENIIKLYLQSNVYLSQTDIRIAYINATTMNILNSDFTPVANLNNITSPLGFSLFDVVQPAGDANIRLLDVSEGKDMSFVYSKKTTSWENQETYFCKHSGVRDFNSYRMPTQGASFSSGIAAANGVAIVGDKYVLSVNDNGVWKIKSFTFNDGVFTEDEVLDAANVKMMRPERVVNDASVVYNRGEYADDSYLNFYTDLVITELN